MFENTYHSSDLSLGKIGCFALFIRVLLVLQAMKVVSKKKLMKQYGFPRMYGI